MQVYIDSLLCLQTGKIQKNQRPTCFLPHSDLHGDVALALVCRTERARRAWKEARGCLGMNENQDLEHSSWQKQYKGDAR